MYSLRACVFVVAKEHKHFSHSSHWKSVVHNIAPRAAVIWTVNNSSAMRCKRNAWMRDPPCFFTSKNACSFVREQYIHFDFIRFWRIPLPASWESRVFLADYLDISKWHVRSDEAERWVNHKTASKFSITKIIVHFIERYLWNRLSESKSVNKKIAIAIAKIAKYKRWMHCFQNFHVLQNLAIARNL
jgi:hypothetical protein